MIRPRSWKALAAATLAGGMSLGICCSLLLARPGKVVTKGGQSYEGEVTENPQQGSVDIVTAKGERVKVLKGNVNRIEWGEEAPPDNPPLPPGVEPVPPDNTPAPAPTPAPGSIEEDLRNRLASLPRNDVANRIKLARAALQRREYGVARDALDQATQIDPRNQEAQDLLRTVDAQRRMDQRNPNPGANPRNPADDRAPGERDPGGAPGAAQGGGTGPSIPPLNADDVNRIRQREWTRNDRMVKIRLVGDVKRRYVASNRDIRPADFNNLNAIQQGWEIVSKGDEEMQNGVRLTTDPASMQAYRTIVQRAILPTCAAAACHGGPQGGRFQLYPRADHDGEAYANFLILSTYTYTPKPDAGAQDAPAAQGAPPAQGGQPGAAQPAAPGAAPGAQGAPGAAAGAPPAAPAAAPGGPAPAGATPSRPRGYQMIDRDRPADSLLIQFALPRNLADTPHPDVPGFKPVFRMLKDPKYDQFLRWISNDLAPPPQRDYGIEVARNRGQQDMTTPARPGQAPPGQPGQAQPGQPQPGQQQPGQRQSGQAQPGQAEPGQAQPAQGQIPAQGQGQNRAAPPPPPPAPPPFPPGAQ